MRVRHMEFSPFHFFFFQAEDGIRDHCVTGVQTCALPISRLLTDYHQISSHRRLVKLAKVAEGPGPVCSERDGCVLALRQDNVTYVRIRANNSLLSRVPINGRIERVR